MQAGCSMNDVRSLGQRKERSASQNVLLGLLDHDHPALENSQESVCVELKGIFLILRDEDIIGDKLPRAVKEQQEQLGALRLSSLDCSYEQVRVN